MERLIGIIIGIVFIVVVGLILYVDNRHFVQIRKKRREEFEHVMSVMDPDNVRVMLSKGSDPPQELCEKYGKGVMEAINKPIPYKAPYSRWEYSENRKQSGGEIDESE